MKKLVLLTLVAIFVVACNPKNDNQGEKKAQIKKEKVEEKKEKVQDKKDLNKEEAFVLPDVLARVNGEEIKKEEVLDKLKIMEERYKMYGQSMKNKQKMRLAKSNLRNIIDAKLIMLYAKDLKIELSKEEIDAKLKEIKGRFPNEETFLSMLKKQNMTEEQFVENIVKRTIITTKVLDKEVYAKIKIDPKDIEKHYNENYKDGEVKARHILFKTSLPKDLDKKINDLKKKTEKEFKKAGKTDEKELKKLVKEKVTALKTEENKKAKLEVTKKAKTVLDKIKANPKLDFAKLATEVSEGPSNVRGGDLGWFIKKRMVPKFSEAAFKLKKGEVSGLVETRFGTHIIKVEDKRVKTLDELKENIEKELKQKKRNEIMKEIENFKKMLNGKYKVENFLEKEDKKVKSIKKVEVKAVANKKVEDKAKEAKADAKKKVEEGKEAKDTTKKKVEDKAKEVKADAKKKVEEGKEAKDTTKKKVEDKAKEVKADAKKKVEESKDTSKKQIDKASNKIKGIIK